MELTHCFQTGRIGALEIKNRIMMAPMMTILSGVMGEVTRESIAWYVRRAKGGAGLIVTEPVFVATSIDPIRPSSRILRADDDSYTPGFAVLAEAIHEAGSLLGVQMHPGGGAQAFQNSCYLPGEQNMRRVVPVSPSGVTAYGVFNKNFTAAKPRILSLDEIEKCIELCGKAAFRFKTANVDLIELNAHEGWLAAQFLSPYFNKREDAYGGSLKNRCRFVTEIIKSIKQANGSSYPVIIKYSIDEFIQGGRGVEESQDVAKIFQEAGADGIVCSLGVLGSSAPPIPPYNYPPRSLDYLAESIKKSVNIPVTALFNMDDYIAAEKMLAQNRADFIGIARGLIADPDLPNKLKAGKFREIRPCVKCNACRLIHNSHPIRCAVNPTAGREQEFPSIPAAYQKKKVVVVGGGPAGMEAARVCALKGHDVTLIEKETELGGMLRFGSKPPRKDILLGITNYYSNELAKLGVELIAGELADAQRILDQKPDAVILATGGTFVKPDIPGINSPRVLIAIEALQDESRIGASVIIFGGGSTGCELAIMLARLGKTVTVVEQLQDIGEDIEVYTRNEMFKQFSSFDISIFTSSTIESVTDDGAVIVDGSSNKRHLTADSIILAFGMKSYAPLFPDLEGKVEEVHVIGDAKRIGKIRQAISEGFITALNLQAEKPLCRGPNNIQRLAGIHGQ